MNQPSEQVLLGTMLQEIREKAAALIAERNRLMEEKKRLEQEVDRLNARLTEQDARLAELESTPQPQPTP
ncbi:MAG: hypothetical protein VX880_02175, partial [Bacteroidota bacterium]|nr:hypothetical protein [Bacteroidota bacterium]